MVFVASLLFILHTFTLGFFIVNIFKGKNKDSFLKRRLYEFIFGFSLLNFIPYVMGFVGIPMNIWILTLISLSLFIITLITIHIRYGINNYLENEFTFTPPKKQPVSEYVYLIVTIFLFLVGSYVYFTTTINQTQLENGDPWSYAAQGVYVSETQSYYLPDGAALGNHLYLQPVPRRLTILTGLYLQVSDTPLYILKYFFAYFLIIGLAALVLFFKEFSKSNLKTMLATLFIVSAPSFTGRFIYENNLAVILIGACLIATVKLFNGEKKYFWIGAFAFAAQFVSHPATAFLHFLVIASIFCAFFTREIIIDRKKLVKTKTAKYFLMVSLGVLLSIICYIQPFMMYGRDAYDMTGESPGFRYFGTAEGGELRTIMHYNPNYSLSDFFRTLPYGQIDQSIGVGEVLFTLLLIGIIYLLIKMYGVKTPFMKIMYKEPQTLITGFIISFTVVFLLTYFGYKTGFSLFTGRYWPVLMIVSGILFAEFLGSIGNMFKNKFVLGLLLILLFYGVYHTSFYQRYSIQSSDWPVHKFHPQDLPGYNFVLHEIPTGAMVYPICRVRSFFMFGLNKGHSFYRTEEHREFYRNLKEKTPEDIFEYVDSLEYEYYVVDSACITEYDMNETIDLINLMNDHPNYSIIYNQNAFLVFRRSFT